ncbi:hypothetical protein MNBD_GAMMA12-2818 [hydrothermal vent metagenome]|uniref:HTH lysR-type domain-containing protein n=1 Tax=hydrothermal vent metagenome TaxID=652676 RepID=A0A3B0ZLA0_9ZZZZ
MSWSLNDFDRLNPRLFKAFMAASETNSFTIAADVACMTQGGISQHISKLEEQVGRPLFRRTKNQVILTDTGRRMVSYVKRYLEIMNDFRESVARPNENLSGLITCAMPASCLLLPYFKLLLHKCLKYDKIELSIILEPSKKVVESVLHAKADFGFAADACHNTELDYTQFYTEEYVLVGTKRFIRDKMTLDQIIKMRFVRYPGFDDCSEQWLNAIRKSHNGTNTLVNYSGYSNTIDTAIIMVKGGLGVSIFPRHCVKNLLLNEELVEYSIQAPVLNSISIITTKNQDPPKRVSKVVNWFMEMKC